MSASNPADQRGPLDSGPETTSAHPDHLQTREAAYPPGHSPSGKPGGTGNGSQVDGVSNDSDPFNRSRIDAVVSSALWAAYGDALGFITELGTEAQVRQRVAALPEAPVPWKRRVGGRSGVTVDLPAGCYSDDTQLRLAVSRAISADGFDVEAFARVELPVWPAYALGGGVASKKAAAGFAKPNADWYANFYPGWTEAGGNGAAMRIQPHLWAAPDPGRVGRADVDVVLDAITTHGHPRALVGAVLHGRGIAFALTRGRVPQPSEWGSLCEEVASVPNLLGAQHQWDTVWRPRWEAHTGEAFTAGWRVTLTEASDLLALAAEVDDGEPAEMYASLVGLLGLTDPARRGSGTHTVVAAFALAAWCDGNPELVSRVAAHTIGTDTDTIATMAAALAGASWPDLPSREFVLDYDYVALEGVRVAQVAVAPEGGSNMSRFAYPDLLSWQAPRTQADCLGTADGALALAGLAWCSPAAGGSFTAGQFCWTWVTTEFGQTMIIKGRPHNPPLPQQAWPARQRPELSTAGPVSTERKSGVMTTAGVRGAPDALESGDASGGSGFGPNGANQHPTSTSTPAVPGTRPDLPTRQHGPRSNESASTRSVQGPELTARDASTGARDSLENVERMLRWVARNGYTDADVGYAIRRLSQVGSLNQTVAFVALLSERLSNSKPNA